MEDLLSATAWLAIASLACIHLASERRQDVCMELGMPQSLATQLGLFDCPEDGVLEDQDRLIRTCSQWSDLAPKIPLS